MQCVNANGSALTPGLLQYAWSHVPEDLRARARAYMHPSLLLDMRAHHSFYMTNDVYAGVPCVTHRYMLDNQIAISSEGILCVIVTNIHNRSVHSAGRRCQGCGWTMSITETEREQIYCNRCEDQLQLKYGASLRNTYGLTYRERHALREAYELMPVPPLDPNAYMLDSERFTRGNA
jgi:hypothetical protein